MSREVDLQETVGRIVERGALQMGVALPIGAGAAFDAYRAALELHGKNVNLTSITGAEDVARLHFLDSLALLLASDFKNARVIDIGSGAGFPGLPLKIAEQTIELTMLDATGKRVSFLSALCAELGVSAACIHARAEESAREPQLRERFDIATSRAVARLNVLCELCLPFVRVGGVFLAMKGTDSTEELEEALGAIQMLGAEHDNTVDYTIADTDITHRILVIRKTSQTPEEYPRRFAKMKRPVGR